jgi:hypothetical protein
MLNPGIHSVMIGVFSIAPIVVFFYFVSTDVSFFNFFEFFEAFEKGVEYVIV